MRKIYSIAFTLVFLLVSMEVKAQNTVYLEEGFEDWATGSTATLPTGWDNSDVTVGTSTSSSYKWYATLNAVDAHSGSKYAYLCASPNYSRSARLKTPAKYLSLTRDVKVSFWLKNQVASGSLGDFSLYYSINGDSYAGNVIVSHVSTGNQWQFYEYTLPDTCRGKNVSIIFEGSSGFMTSYYYYLDDIKIMDVPTCQGPVSPYVSGLTSNSATVNWVLDTQYGVAPDRFSVTLRNADDSVVYYNANVVNDGTNQFTFTGLASDETYTAYLRSNCLAAYANYSDSVSAQFTTVAPARNPPFFEPFDSLTDLPGGYYHSASTSLNTLNTYSYGSAGNSAKLVTTAADGAYIVFPLLNIAANNIEMDFYLLRQTAATTDVEYTVSAVTDPSDIEGTQILLYQDTVAYDALWHNVRFNTASLSSTVTPVMLCIYFNSGYAATMYVDNVDIHTIPMCRRPENLSCSAITDSTVTLSWNMSNASSFVVKATSVTDTLTLSASASPYTVNGLSQNTDYTFTVQGICSATDSSDVSLSASARTGCAVAASAIFSEDFSTWVANAASDCWQMGWFHKPEANTKPVPFTMVSTSGNYHSASKGMSLVQQTAGSVSYLSSRALPIDVAGKYNLSVWVKRATLSTIKQNEGIQLWITNAPDDTTGGVMIGYIHREPSLSPIDVAGWHKYEYNIPVAGIKHIMIVGISEYGNPTYFDDVEVSLAPQCQSVSSFNVGNVTPRSAEITWSAGRDETEWIVDYQVKQGSDIIIDSIGVIVTGQPKLTLSGLTIATIYSVTASVRAICGEGDTSEVSTLPSASFTTQCENIATLPYTMRFEDDETYHSYSTYIHPLCWTLYNDATNGTSSYRRYPYVATTYKHSGSSSLYYYSSTLSSYYSDTATFALPEIDTTLHRLNELRVRFWTRQSTASYNQTLFIGAMTDPRNPSTFVKIDSVVVTGSTFVENTIELSSYTGNAKYIALGYFKADMKSTYTGIYLDDMTVEEIPTCRDIVGSVALSNITESSVEITLADQTATTGWSYAYGEAGTPVAQLTPVDTTGASIVFTGLTPSTNYEIYVRRNCGGGDYSPWSYPVSFATTAVPAVAPYICDFEDDTENANWKFVPGANATNIFVVGMAEDAVHSGSQSIYVSDDSGINNSYTIAGCATRTYAYRTVRFDAKGYQIEFYWKCPGGEGVSTIYDYGRVMLIPTSEPIVGAGNTSISSTSTGGFPASAIFLDPEGTNNMHLAGSGWHFLSKYVNMSDAPGYYNLVLVWNNSASLGNQSPLAIDDINITELSCIPPTEITPSAITATSATLNVSQATATQWQFIADTVAFTKNSVPANPMFRINSTDGSATLTGLTPNTDYYYSVRTICGVNDTSNWIIPASLHTSCLAYNTPFSETFEDARTVKCWSMIPDASGNASISRVTSPHRGGRASLKSVKAAVVSPELNVDSLSKYMIEGYAYSTSDNVEFAIGAALDPSDAASVVNVSTSLISNKNTWIPFTAYFTSLDTLEEGLFKNAKHICLSCGDQTIYFDDITVALVPSCPKPTDVRITNVTDTSFDISFVDNAGVSSWIVDANGTERVITTNPATISGLIAHNTYDVSIAAICSATDTSDFMFYGTVTTSCAAIPTPWTCSFETIEGYSGGTSFSSTSSLTVNAYANCWDVLSNREATATSGYPYAYVSSSAAHVHSGTQGTNLYSGTSGTNLCLVLPEFSDPSNMLRVRVWYKNSSASATQPQLKFGYFTNPAVATSFVPVTALDLIASWTQAEILTNAAGYNIPANARIGFMVEKGLVTSGIYVDDISITLIRSCSDPDAPVVSNITASSANITFTDTCSAHAAWEYVYGPSGFNPNTATATAITTRTFAISGLADASNYDVYVRAVCGAGDVSNYVKASFTTLCLPFVVSATTPFADSFENLSAGAPLAGCYVVEGSYGSYFMKGAPNDVATVAYARTGSHSLYAYGIKTHAPDGLNAFRQMHLTAGKTYKASVWVRNTSPGNIASIVLGNAPAFDSTSTVAYLDVPACTAVSVGGVTDYAHCFQEISGYFTISETGDYWVGLHADKSPGQTAANIYAYFDDFAVEELEGCLPSALTVDSTTQTTVVAHYADTVASNTYEYMVTMGVDTIVAPTVATSNPFTVSGLSSSTTHTLHLRRVCGSGSYSEWNTAEFTTQCGKISSLPYAMGFEDDETYVVYAIYKHPKCWTHYNDLANTSAEAHYYPYTTISSPHTGSSSLYNYSGNTASFADIAIFALPEIDTALYDLSNLHIKFWTRQSNVSYSQDIQVGAMTDPANPATFALVGTVNVNGSNYTQHKVSFAQYVGNASYIAFRFRKSDVLTAYSGIYLDDILVEPIPPCEAPETAPAVVAATKATMTVQAAMAGKDSIEFGIAPHFAGITSAAIDTTIISTDGYATFTGLASSTRYAVWYRYHCGVHGYSGWSALCGTGLTTSSDCFDPQNLRTVGMVNQHHAELTWGGAPDAYRYEYELYLGRNANGTLIDSSSVAVADTVVYDSLATNTEYFFRVRGFCLGDTTAWKGKVFKTTNIPASLPYSCTFENIADAAYWEMGNNNGDNNFIIGTGTSHGGAKSLYVSSNGSAYSYSSASNQAFARVLIPMTAGKYVVSYDYYCYGDASNDYGRLFLYPVANAVGCIDLLSITAPAGNIAISPAVISSMAGWQSARYIVTVPEDAMYYFQANWRDNAIAAYTDPLAIDNIRIEEMQCMPVSSVDQVAVNSRSAEFVANRYTAGIDIQYGCSTYDSQDSVAWTTIQGAGLTDTIALAGLLPNTNYYLFVRQACDSDLLSSVTRVEFHTLRDPLQIPFVCGFENGDPAANAWVLDGTNSQFAIGSAVASQGSRSMYISNDGSSWNYTLSAAASVSFAYVPLAFAPGTYDFEYDWNGYGEATFDYARVCLAPAAFVPTPGSLPVGLTNTATPSDWIPLDGGAELNLASAWTPVSVERSFADSTVMNFVIVWRNDGNNGTPPPFAIDNIRIHKLTCLSLPFDSILVDSVGETFITVSYYNPNEGAATKWIVSSDQLMTDTVAMGLNPDSVTTISLTGLTPGTSHYFFLYSVCDSADISRVLRFNVSTICNVITQFPYDEDFEDITPGYLNSLAGKCWVTTAMTHTLNAVASTDVSHVHSGYQGLYVNNGTASANVQILALPEMDTLNGKTVSFWHKAYNVSGSYNTLSFGYLDAANQFVSLDALTNKVTDWSEYTTLVRNLPAGVNRLAFRFTGSYYYYLDDIHINKVVAGPTYNDTICFGDGYSGHGFSYPAGSFAPGDTVLTSTQRAVLPGEADSVITVNLFVRPQIFVAAYDTVCEGEPYVKGMWNIQNPATRQYASTFQALCGCDSTVTLSLYVYPATEQVYDTICQGDAYQFGGQTLTQSGVYTDSILNPLGCMVATTLNLLVVDSVHIDNVGICEGGTYLWQGQYYSQKGIYRVSKPGLAGCSLTMVLNLNVYQSTFTIDTTFCHGGQVQVVDTIITTTGSYTLHRFNYQTGCDITYNVTATEDPISTGTDSDESCEGKPYYGFGIAGVILSADTTFTFNTRTADGRCDSAVVVTIGFVPTVTGEVEEVTIPKDSSYIWHDQSYVASGTYRDTVPSLATGCDSICILKLTVDQGSAVENPRVLEVCIVPNPVTAGQTSFVYVDAEVVEVEVLNSFGQVVDSFVPDGYPIEVTGVGGSGIYYVRLLLRDGSVAVEKLIVK